MIAVKVGRTGKKVHAGYVAAVVQKGSNIVTYYGCKCGVVNTHNINSHPTVRLLPEGTEINCDKCLQKAQRQD